MSDGAKSGRGFIVVRRGDDSAGAARRMLIKVDGTTLARLRVDDEQVIPVEPGTHTVIAAMDWTSSHAVRVDVGVGETVRLRAALPWSVLWRMVTAPRSAVSLTLERSPRTG